MELIYRSHGSFAFEKSLYTFLNYENSEEVKHIFLEVPDKLLLMFDCKPHLPNERVFKSFSFKFATP